MNPITKGDTPRAVVRAIECSTVRELEKIIIVNPITNNTIPIIMPNIYNISLF